MKMAGKVAPRGASACVLSLVFLCAWEYCTIVMGAPWFFPLFGGALLCGEKRWSLPVRCWQGGARKAWKRAQEAQDETEPLARQRALADSAMRLMALLFLLVWTGLATYAALTAHISPVIWLFPAAGLVMLAAFVATGGALRGGGGQPPRAQSARDDARPAPCPLLGLMLAALCLTLAVPAGAPWATCLVPFAVAAVGVAAAIVNARKHPKTTRRTARRAPQRTARAARRRCRREKASARAAGSGCGRERREKRTREPEGAAIRPRRELMARGGFAYEERQARARAFAVGRRGLGDRGGDRRDLDRRCRLDERAGVFLSVWRCVRGARHRACVVRPLQRHGQTALLPLRRHGGGRGARSARARGWKRRRGGLFAPACGAKGGGGRPLLCRKCGRKL